MQWTRSRSEKGRLRPTVNRIRPTVEELEDRYLLTAGSLEVATRFIQSVENRTNFITSEYQTFLHRPPDAAGLADWVSGLQNGLTPERVDASFASSAEYLALHNGLGADWVRSLYQDFLNRPADTAGLDAWQRAITNGESAFDIALGFATSPEREARVITNDYQRFLGRTPEAGAVAGWQAELSMGLSQEGLAAQIVGSDEFYVRLGGGTDAGFVSAIYQAVLSRTPSVDEVNGWLTFLSNLLTPPADAGTPLVTLNLDALNINLLGLQVQTNDIQVRISAQPGEGALLGNLLTTVSNLINLEGVNNALNNVLSSVVTLVNSVDLSFTGVVGGPLSTAAPATIPVLDAFVAPVHLNLLGAVVDTSPIHLTITANSGNGLVLGNVVSALANLFNPPLPDRLDLTFINDRLRQLIDQLNAAIPGIPPAPTTPPPTTGTEQILSLTLPPIDLDLLGLMLQTSQIQVNVDAQSGNGALLGNVVTVLLNTVGATPQSLSDLNTNLNNLLAKVVGVLNAANLTLPPDALNTLSQVLQTLALPDLINSSGTPATAPILDLIVASQNGNTPPVDVNLLGLKITTSNIRAQLLAQTGDGQILGNLLYNVAHLLDPGGSLNLLAILNALAL